MNDLINYFNFEEYDNDRILITNDLGSYEFLSRDEFRSFIGKNIDPDSVLYGNLVEGGFIIRSTSEDILRDYASRLRMSKEYLFSGTSLHIFVLTDDCNMNCVYCQARDHKRGNYSRMDADTARKAVEMAVQSPAKYLDFEFQGGEPLLNFEILKLIVEYSKEINIDHVITYSVVTNLTLINDEIIEFLQENDIRVSTSIDGPTTVHDINRPFAGGKGTLDTVKKAVEKLRQKGIAVSAIQTTTRRSLDYPEEIVDEYVNDGFSSVFIRPLTRLGTAASVWNKIGYDADEFVSFYRRCLNRVIEANKSGICFSEGFAGMLLNKLLHGRGVNYMELRSPCGAAVGQVAYYFNGDVYTCDEGRMLAEMGDPSFKLGNVFADSYNDIMGCSVCSAVCTSSVLETIPGCCDCVFQPYCGVCPVIIYSSEKDIYKREPNDYRCRINKGVIRTLFDLLLEEDPETMSILEQWC